MKNYTTKILLVLVLSLSSLLFCKEKKASLKIEPADKSKKSATTVTKEKSAPAESSSSLFSDSVAILDFESGDLDIFDETKKKGTGILELSDAIKKDGKYALHAVTTSGAVNDQAQGIKKITEESSTSKYYLEFDINLAKKGKSTMNISIAAIMDRTGSWSELLIVRLKPGSSTINISMRETGDFGSTSTGVSTKITEGQWYHVKVLYDISGASAVSELWVDDKSCGSFTGTGSPSTDAPAALDLGVSVINADVNNWAEVYIDNVACHDGSQK